MQIQEWNIEPVFSVGNARIMGRDFRNVTEEIREAGAVGDGTILIRFRNYKKQGYMALMTVVNDQYPASYLTAYIKHANQVGFLKNVISKDHCITKTLDIHADLSMDFGFVNTMALTAREGEGYCLYYNGQKVQTVNDTDASILRDVLSVGQLQDAMLGDFLEPQKMLERHYAFHGDIDFIRIYDKVLPEDWLRAFTSQSHVSYEVPVPEGTWRSEPQVLFDQGMGGSRGYRIPTIQRTRQGTLLAFIDKRYFGGADHPNRIHTVLRRSEDNGQTWGEPITVMAMPKNAQTIDTCSVQDRETGRIFLITDAFPETMTTFTVKSGTGWRTEDGEPCRILLNGDVAYLAHSNGRVTLEGRDTGMRLLANDDLVDGDGRRLGNVWTENCRLKLYPTDHLLLLTSDDDGRSWEVRRDLNQETKEDWMKFFGCGPGVGIQLENGPHRGRLLLPVYFFNQYDRQAAALLYSDDHGETWHRGASPVDGWMVDGMVLHSQTLDRREYETLEAQLVELPDGTVLYYMRNGRQLALGAYSRDGGETWATEENFYDEALTGPCGQFGIVKLMDQLDGQPAYGCSIHLHGRNCGTVELGLAKQIPPTASGRTWEIDWKYRKDVWEGTYCYSGICSLPEERVGVFFESSSSASMTFQRMDVPFLKSGVSVLEPPKLLKRELRATADGTEVVLKWNLPIMPMGSMEVLLKNEGKTVRASCCNRPADLTTLVFQAPLTDTDLKDWTIAVPEELEIYSCRGVRWQEQIG